MNAGLGIQRQLKFAVIGFAIPGLVIGLMAAYHFTFNDIHPLDRANDLAGLPMLILVPSIGLGMLFGLAAIGSSPPSKRVSFVRSLIVISATTAIAVFATRPRIDRKTVDPDTWVEVVVPVAAALVATISVLIYNKCLSPDKTTAN